MKPVVTAHWLSMFQFLIYNYFIWFIEAMIFALENHRLCLYFSKPEHVIPFYISFFFQVTRPQPLSTISKRSANEKVMSRAGFINNVLNKIEEVWLGKGATPESSPSRRWAKIKKVLVVSRFWIIHSLIHSFIHLFLIARELLRFRSPNPLWPFQTPSWELQSPWPQNESQGSVLRDPHQCTDYVEMR